MLKNVSGCIASLLIFFTCYPAALHAADAAYPIKIGPTHRYFVDRNNHPFLMQGDSAWSLIVGVTKDEAEQYLENRRRKGFNTVIVNLIEHKFNGPKNRDGEGPFLVQGDFSTPNEKYFQHADWVIRKAGEKGILVLLLPIFLGYKGTDAGWIEEALANGPEKCHAWGLFIGKRYKDFDNIMWMMGSDRKPGDALKDVNAVVAGIKENDGRRLFTAQGPPEDSAVDSYGDTGWLDFNTTYTYEVVHHKLISDYNYVPLMPFVLVESTYEGEYNATPVQVRRQAYWAMLCGATGQFIGNYPLWGFYSGWQAAMDATASADMVFLLRLFQSRPWYDLVPDQSGSTNVNESPGAAPLPRGVVTRGIGEVNGLDYVAAARTSDGGTVMAYLPSSRTVTVDMSKISGSQAKVWWFNPRTGSATASGEFPTRGSREFTPPAEGDWVLVLDDASRKLPAPGARSSSSPLASRESAANPGPNCRDVSEPEFSIRVLACGQTYGAAAINGNRRPGGKTVLICVLTDEQIKRIHETSLAILERAGVVIPHEEILSRFADVGAVVDRQKQHVKIPPDLVMSLVNKAEKRFTLYGRDLARKAEFGYGKRSQCSIGGEASWVDELCQPRRWSTLADVATGARLGDALPYIDLVGAMAVPHEIDVRSRPVEVMAMALKNTTKPLWFWFFSRGATKYLMDMMIALRGDAKSAAQYPLLLFVRTHQPAALSF